MHNIAIIGTQGVGKTVFISVLAHHLTRDNSLGLFLNPQDTKTQISTETTWRTLNNREWPPATSAGNSFDLTWHLEEGGRKLAALHLIDPSGHDLRLIFSGSQALPEGLKPLADYCHQANVAVFLINLDEYIDRPDGSDIENEAILNIALNSVLSRGGKGCIVFTQADRYEGFLAESAPSTASAADRWLAVAAKHLPVVYGAHLKNKSVEVFPISCVSETEKKVSEQGICEVPKPGFCSKGLDRFLPWMLAAVIQGKTPVVPPPIPSTPSTSASWPALTASVISLLVFMTTCYKKKTPFFGPDTIEFNWESIPMAMVALLVIWGVLAGIRWLISQGTKRV